MSRLDRSLTNSYYEIEIDPETQLPVSINTVLIAAIKGESEAKGKKIVGGRHVAFHFKYTLSDFGKVKPPSVPKEARKLLARG